MHGRMVAWWVCMLGLQLLALWNRASRVRWAYGQHVCVYRTGRSWLVGKGPRRLCPRCTLCMVMGCARRAAAGGASAVIFSVCERRACRSSAAACASFALSPAALATSLLLKPRGRVLRFA